MKIVTMLSVLIGLLILLVNIVQILMAGMTSTVDTFIVGITVLIIAAFFHKKE